MTIIDTIGMRMPVIIIILILSHFNAAKIQAANSDFELKEFNSCSFCSLKHGFRLLSLTDYRGITVDPNPQIMPGIAAYFYNNQLEILPMAVNYYHYTNEPYIRFRYRLYQVTDKPVIKIQNQDTTSYFRRENTFEAQFRVETFWGGNSDDYVAEVSLSYSKDMKNNWGDYLELLTKFKLESFLLDKPKVNLEPNFFASIGWGSRSQNQYIYGPEANTNGFNNIAYGLWLAIPNRADRYYPIILIKRFETLQSKFKNADYAKDHNNGVAISLLYSVKVL